MKWLAFAVLAVFLGSSAAVAQDDKQKLKQEILKKVEEMIKKEEEKLLKEIEKLIDEELARAKPKEPPKEPPKQAPRKGRGYLGVRPQPLTDEEREELGLKAEDGGVKIMEVLPDTAAEKAGLEVDDVILSVDGTKVEDVQALVRTLQGKGAGTKIKLVILRDGKKKELEVELGRHPDDPPEEKKEEKKEDKKEEGRNEKQRQPPVPADEEQRVREKIKEFQKRVLAENETRAAASKMSQDEIVKKLEEYAAKVFDSEEGQKLLEAIRGHIEDLGGDPDKFVTRSKEGKLRPTGKFAQDLARDLKESFLGLLGKKEPELKKPGKPFLGIQVDELTEDERAEHNLEAGVGVLVSLVKENSPAAKAGLKKGDILVKINGKSVRGEESLVRFMAQAKPGDQVELAFVRDGREQTVKVTLDERKE